MSTTSTPRYLAPQSLAEMIGVRFLEGDGDGDGKGSEPGAKTFSEDYVRALRQESAGFRTQLRAAEQARDAAIAERDAMKTELDTVKASTGEADARVAGAEAKALRLEVALEKGLPLTLASRLQGTTKDELTADADALVKMTGAQGTATFDQGNTGKALSAPNVNDALRALSGMGSVEVG